MEEEYREYIIEHFKNNSPITIACSSKDKKSCFYQELCNYSNHDIMIYCKNLDNDVYNNWKSLESTINFLKSNIVVTLYLFLTDKECNVDSYFLKGLREYGYGDSKQVKMFMGCDNITNDCEICSFIVGDKEHFYFTKNRNIDQAIIGLYDKKTSSELFNKFNMVENN